MQTILIIEDEKEIADTLSYAINSEGMQTLWADNGAKALQALTNNHIDLCVLDVGLPDCSGFELLKDIRKNNTFDKNIPVLMLTARNEEIDRIVGLEIGADDYVAKPFSPREVVARIKAILKRSVVNSLDENVLTNHAVNPDSINPNTSEPNLTASSHHGFNHDGSRRAISYNESTLALTKAEYALLLTFIEQPGRVFSRRQLIDRVWSSNHPSDDRAIDTHIKTLRAKLRSHNPHKDFIVTHRGFGYSIEL